MPRKDIDLSDQHIANLDALRAERRVSYSDLVKAALDQYFAPRPSTETANLNERLSSLDSSSQKTAERLGELEAIAQQTMELIILLSEAWTTSNGVPVLPASEPEAPVIEEVSETSEVLEPVPSRWQIPEPKPPEKRGWFHRSRP
jgi:hypothetical protein